MQTEPKELGEEQANPQNMNVNVKQERERELPRERQRECLPDAGGIHL